MMRLISILLRRLLFSYLSWSSCGLSAAVSTGCRDIREEEVWWSTIWYLALYCGKKFWLFYYTWYEICCLLTTRSNAYTDFQIVRLDNKPTYQTSHLPSHSLIRSILINICSTFLYSKSSLSLLLYPSLCMPYIFCSLLFYPLKDNLLIRKIITKHSFYTLFTTYSVYILCYLT